MDFGYVYLIIILSAIAVAGVIGVVAAIVSGKELQGKIPSRDIESSPADQSGISQELRDSTQISSSIELRQQNKTQDCGSNSDMPPPEYTFQTCFSERLDPSRGHLHTQVWQFNEIARDAVGVASPPPVYNPLPIRLQP